MRGKLLFGVVTLTGLSTGVGYYQYKKRLSANAGMTPQIFHEQQAELLQPVLNPEEFSRLPKTLYQYTTCPYCCKLKAFLDYYKVEYSMTEVNPLTKKEVKENGYGKVPQLQIGVNGPIIVDSNEIVKILKPILDKDAPEITPEEETWKNWASSTLPRYMVINTNRTLGESMKGYTYVPDVKEFSATDKFILKLFGGPIMYGVSSIFTKKRLQKESSYDASNPRKGLYTEINGWVENGLGDSKFHGGNAPDCADLDVYGVIQSVRFFPVYEELKENSSPKYTEWLNNMDALMPAHYKL